MTNSKCVLPHQYPLHGLTPPAKRSNYAEPTLLVGEDDDEGGKSAKGRARQTISDKRDLSIPGTSAAAKKKKSTMNIRTALLYRKNLATLIDESVRTVLISLIFAEPVLVI